MSRPVNPVPPVVIITSKFLLFVHLLNIDKSSLGSSLTISLKMHVWPQSSTSFFKVDPDLSLSKFRVSEIVNIAIFIPKNFIDYLSFLNSYFGILPLANLNNKSGFSFNLIL